MTKIQTKLYTSNIITDRSAITLHLNTKNPKITHTFNKTMHTRAFRELNDECVVSKEISDSDFNASYYAAIEHQKKQAGTDVFDMSAYEDVKLTNALLEKVNNEQDSYDFIGSCDVALDGGGAVTYDQVWIKVNRFGAIVYGQLFKTGDTNAKIIKGFLHFAPLLPPSIPVGTANGSVITEIPNIQNIRVVDEIPPLVPPSASGIIITGDGPITIANTINISQDPSGITSFNIDILANDIETIHAIDPNSVVLIDPSNESNIGIEGTPLIVAGIGTYEHFGGTSVLNFTSTDGFYGIATIKYKVKDINGNESNESEISILINQ